MKRALSLLAALPIAVAGCGSSSSTSAKASGAGAGPSKPPGAEASVISLDAHALTVKLPLYKGVTASGRPTYYVITDASTVALARKYGVNPAPKLANALGTKAVQTVRTGPAGIVFPGTVNFHHTPRVVPSKTGFPPTVAIPGPLADARYSPLITTRNGAVIDAPQVANDTGVSDALVRIDYTRRTATLKLLDGFVDGVHNYYVRTDGSIPLLAAIESSTYAPSLNAARGIGSDSTTASARSAIVPVVNGPRASAGANQRQGLRSALLGEGPPENIEQDPPGGQGYSPLWDVTPVLWTPKAIAAHRVVRLTSVAAVIAAVKAGDLASAGTGPVNRAIGVRELGAVSNCSIVSVG
jgi:hypothetical protein